MERDEDDTHVVECPLSEGCYTQGKTLDEALVNVRRVIHLILEEAKNRRIVRGHHPRELSVHTIIL